MSKPPTAEQRFDALLGVMVCGDAPRAAKDRAAKDRQRPAKDASGPVRS